MRLDEIGDGLVRLRSGVTKVEAVSCLGDNGSVERRGLLEASLGEIDEVLGVGSHGLDCDGAAAAAAAEGNVLVCTIGLEYDGRAMAFKGGTYLL